MLREVHRPLLSRLSRTGQLKRADPKLALLLRDSALCGMRLHPLTHRDLPTTRQTREYRPDLTRLCAVIRPTMNEMCIRRARRLSTALERYVFAPSIKGHRSEATMIASNLQPTTTRTLFSCHADPGRGHPHRKPQASRSARLVGFITMHRSAK